MNKSAILKNLEDLSKNPMFMLSLTSRELFHSNFWAWMLRKYPKVFTKAFYEKYDGRTDVKVYREKNNIDLSLQIGDKFIIIENKFKSMPNKEQLSNYWTKIKTEKKILVLISYFNPLFNLEENWSYLSYQDLCARLQKCLAETNASLIDTDDKVFITGYIKFLELLNQFQENLEIESSDKIGDLWKIIKDKDIQEKLNELNLEKTFQRAFMSKLTLKVLENFKHKDDLSILLDCGRDLKVYSDILIKLHGAWDKNIEDRQDLNYLGVSFWGTNYRYYAGLNRAQCGIPSKKDCRQDSENRQKGSEYLSKKYSWFFNKEKNKNAKWGCYSYEKEMYLYKKIDISEETVEEITQKTLQDLTEIYERIIDRC